MDEKENVDGAEAAIVSVSVFSTHITSILWSYKIWHKAAENSDDDSLHLTCVGLSSVSSAAVGIISVSPASPHLRGRQVA